MPCLKAAIDRIGLVKFVEGVEKASGQGWQTRFIVLSQKPSYSTRTCCARASCSGDNERRLLTTVWFQND